MDQFKYLFLSLRPKQWTKNLILFAGLLFSQNLLVPRLFFETVFAFFIFCFLSGAVYLVNDLVDVEKDRRHPEKKNRPLAARELSGSVAVAAAVVLPVVCFGLALLLNLQFLWVAASYYLLMLVYSFVLKKMVILDVMTIAFGFVFRALAGAVAIEVGVSSWFLICAILLALFLGLAKRRQELRLLEKKGALHREVLSEYSPQLLDQLIAAVTSSTILAYALYTMGEETIAKFGTANLIYTLPFVIYGIFRYLYLMYVQEHGGSPEKVLLTDRPLLINILLYLTAAGVILYS